MRLLSKTALITGGTSGIGRAIAEAFAREGARVVIAGRDAARGRAAVAAITRANGEAKFIKADISALPEVRALAQAAIDALGRVDILVNNAGIYRFAPTHDTDEATFDTTMATNVKGLYFLTGALAPAMAERGRGKIINITTMAAHIGMPTAALYGASKAAVELLTKAWAAEYGPRGVNVNAIAPGPVRTEGAAILGDVAEQLAKLAPAGRVARPEEIAAAAVYLASDESDFVHGATLIIDGGRVAA